MSISFSDSCNAQPVARNKLNYWVTNAWMYQQENQCIEALCLHGFCPKTGDSTPFNGEHDYWIPGFSDVSMCNDKYRRPIRMHLLWIALFGALIATAAVCCLWMFMGWSPLRWLATSTIGFWTCGWTECRSHVSTSIHWFNVFDKSCQRPMLPCPHGVYR